MEWYRPLTIGLEDVAGVDTSGGGEDEVLEARREATEGMLTVGKSNV